MANSRQTQPSERQNDGVRRFAVALAVAVGLTAVYWWPMWLGDGVIGGDIMDYFYPQKVYLSDALARGDVPLWNNTVALGYPFVADSQIAMWYPTTIPLYRFFSVESAFQLNVLIHYGLAFLFTWAYARSLRLRQLGALFAAFVFTYGWFPPRLSVEWAITTGCYFPAALWCVERFLRTKRGRWLGGLAVVLALQLLAGHFSLAFITQLCVAAYALFRVWILRRRDTGSTFLGTAKTIIPVLVIQALAFPLAAAQLAPTWELRQQSQRGGLPIPEVEDGRIPWQHLQQVVTPWIAYDNDMSEYPPPYTNGPAASLFVGVLPFLLAVWLLARPGRRSSILLFWRIAIPVAVLFAVGWVTGIYKHVPGFGYFKVPGRYSLIAALGLAIAAGAGVDRMRAVLAFRCGAPIQRRIATLGLVGTLVGVTFVDLYVYGRRVAFTSFVPLTIDELLRESTLRDWSEQSPEPLRALVPGNNALAATGIAAVPGFLGLAPEAYLAPETKLPKEIDPAGPVAGELDTLRRYGVTHIIFEDPFDAETWQATPVQTFQDAFLSRVMNRFDPETQGIKPWYLARLSRSRGRVAFVDENGREARELSVAVERYNPDLIDFQVTAPSAGRVLLTDLAYPGWSVTVDGSREDSIVVEEVLRGVDVDQGPHRIVWRYEPASIRTGWLISIATAAVILIWLLVNRQRSARRRLESPDVASNS